MSLLLKNDHPALTAHLEICEICKPLFSLFNISFFRYLRVFPDGRRIHLCTNPNWTDHFYNHGFYNVAWCDAKNLINPRNTQALWDEMAVRYDNIVGVDARNHFNIHHGVSMVCPGVGYYEVFDFAASKEHAEVNEAYLNNLDIFEHFFFYFRDKANALIMEQQNNTIKPLDLMERWKTEQNSNNSKNKKFLDFLEETAIKRYYIGSYGGDTYLTRKEVQCIYWASLGKNSEEIGIIMGCSKKTIEAHVDNIKNKLDCTKMTKIIEIATKTGLLETVGHLIENNTPSST